MKKILLSIITVLCGCSSQSSQPMSVIESTCQEISSDVLTSAEVIYWDSLNAEGEYLLIRNAERDLQLNDRYGKEGT